MTIREPICGALVCLAPLSVDDIGRWVRWMEDPDTTRYLYAPGEQPLGLQTAGTLLDWARRILADPERVVFALHLPEGGPPIGDARLTPGRRRSARFSIMIGGGEHRGRGIGTEATRLVCRYGFDQLALRTIVLDVDPRNTPAVRAYRRVGFEHAGGTAMRLDRPAWQAVEAGSPGR